MSKRHQSNRRKTYGRRQHEVHERRDRRRDREPIDVRIDAFGATARTDLIAGPGHAPGARHLRFGTAD